MFKSSTGEQKKLWATLGLSFLLGCVLNLTVLSQIDIWACRLNEVIGYTCAGDVNLAWGIFFSAVTMGLTSLVWIGLHAIAIHFGRSAWLVVATFALAIMVASLSYLYVVSIIGYRIDIPATERAFPDFDRPAAILVLRGAQIALAVQMLIWPVLPLVRALTLSNRS